MIKKDKKKGNMDTILYIKNMVCDRCKMAVRQTLEKAQLRPLNVDLGIAVVEGKISDGKKEELRESLRQLGFELLDDRRQQTIDRIKSLIIQLVHYRDNNSTLNLSDYLTSQLHMDYSTISKLFSEFTSMTIEHYYILQRVERVKELLTYDELSLTQIALKTNYSSVAYLSSQFKQVTGMTPSHFKTLEKNTRKGLDKI